MNEKELIVCVSIFFVFTFFFVTYFLSGGEAIQGRMGVGRDYQFHLANARGEERSYPFIEQHFLEYPPVFKWISSPFSFQEKVFYLFCTLFLVLLIPLVLWFLFKNIFLVVGYFFVSNVVWLIDIIGAYPQVLASVWLLFFVLVKSWKLRLLLLFVGFFVHRWLWMGLLGYWLCEIIVKEVKVWIRKQK